MATSYQVLNIDRVPDEVMEAAQEAVTSLGWRVVFEGADRLVAAEYFMFWGSQPARVTIKVASAEDGTLLILEARRWGIPALQERYLENVLEQAADRIRRRLAGEKIIVAPVPSYRRSARMSVGGYLALAAGGGGTVVMYSWVLSDRAHLSWYHTSLSLLLLVFCMALAVLGYAIIGRSKPSGLIILVPGAIVMLTGLLLLVLSHHVAKEAHLIVVEQVTAVVVGFCAVVAGCLVLSERRRLRRPGIGTSLKR